MGSKKDIVEINGKKYDARTGLLISESAPAPKIRPSAVEGFIKPVPNNVNRSPAQPLQRQPDKPRTLMRHVVPKPKVVSTTDAAPQLFTKQIRTANDIQRAKRATSLTKSQLVKKFNPTTDFVVRKPNQKQHPHNHQQQSENQRPTGRPVPERAKEGPFERAMRTSRSHDQKQPEQQRIHHRLAKKLRISPRLVSAGALVAALFVFGGFFAYQNVSNLKVRYASMRANVDGKLPGYRPAGFTLKGPVEYSPGQITLKYDSTSDDRAFNVSQRASNWDSTTLLSEYVQDKHSLIQTVEDNGKTIYVYGENNATWVDNGVWYQVEGQAALSSDQLLRIARSL